jgi:Dolichyl-phosphate-mannose-protein mannosyltransferase
MNSKLSKHGTTTRELLLLLAVWLACSLLLTTIALRDLSAPGLYYDEAVFAGMAKDFVRGAPAGPHMPFTTIGTLFGRPFPWFVQNYFGGLKCWLLIPSFAVFGSSIGVLRLTTLCLSLVALLFFMLWTRKLVGLPVALVAGPLLALDPSYFYLSEFDWGGVVPSLLCRASGFYFFLLWALGRKWRDGLLSAVLLGLGLFSKVDFAVILLGCGIALFVSFRQAVLAALRDSRSQILVCCLAFLVMSYRMFFFLTDILKEAGRFAGREGAFEEKLHTWGAMYDGSYFMRLIDVGGKFDLMFANAASVWSPFGPAVLAAAIFLAVHSIRDRNEPREARVTGFVVLSLALISLGVFLLPGGVRLHHFVMVYPFPHLVVAMAIVSLWRIPTQFASAKLGLRLCSIALLSAVLAGHVSALWQTQRLIAETGGRGWWTNAIDRFCEDVKDQAGLTIVSLDWGFNEQLCFLTEHKKLSEPFWNEQPALIPGAVYLVHPREYALFPQGQELLDFAARNPGRGFSIQPYQDRQGKVAFYAIQFRPPIGR